MEIDRSNHTPIYLQFYRILKEKILNCEPGDTIPPERVLCEQYNVDRTTVRRALAMIAKEKLIERKRGSGTRVLPRPTDASDGNTVLFCLFHSPSYSERLGEPFYARSIDAFEQYLRKYNKRIVYSSLRSGEDISALCRQFNASAIILAGAVDDATVAQCLDLPVSVVTYNNRVKGLSSALSDNTPGAQMAAEHLLALNHRKIGFIDVQGYYNASVRLDAFRNTLLRNGIPADALCIAEGNWTEQSGYTAMKNLLEKHPDMTALYAGNDSMAIGAIRAAQQAGLRVPDDISVIGFDDIPQASTNTPALTTVRVDISAMVEATYMLLFNINEEKHKARIHTIAFTKLIVRDSTSQAKQP
jgi:LacI family transcriptional regulator